MPSIRHALRSLRAHRRLWKWERSGRPAPPPHLYKQRVLREHARRFGLRTLVETGTFEGDMVQAMRGDFDQIFSIELSPEFHAAAAKRFAGCEQIEIIQGDSGRVLGELTPRLDAPALFWLDGHYSAGATARGDKDTPVLEELHAIYGASDIGHVVLIDDARCFGAEAGYPAVDQLRSLLTELGADADLGVECDIIRVTPRSAALRKAG